MDQHGQAGARGARGRVVMLVDNGVTVDSRVQKAARSAAAAGWDVTLLGVSPTGHPETWPLGAARVRLLAMPAPLATRRHEFRRAWLRWPLAYPPSGIAAHRAQAVKAWQTDIRVRAAAGSGRPLGLKVERAAAGLLRRWVSFRYWMLTRARRGRRKLTGPRDRAYTWFWRTVRGDRAWRRLEPGLWDYELAFGPVVDELEPDLIHANDFRMLGVGARAAIRARAAGRPVKLVWDSHEYLPGVVPWRDNARWLPANVGHEREYAPYADAVVTVSERLADMLRADHGLAERPAVVLNAPALDDAPPDGEPMPDLRERCGVAAGVPLLLYSGVAARKRGTDIMVEALPRLDGAHAVFVFNHPDGDYARQLRAKAAELGVADRVHFAPYVPYWQVVRYLSGADVGVVAMPHVINNEIALNTKFFEYSHARLPLVVSDVKTIAETVRATGQGEVFRAEDLDDFVRAVTAVLADPARYRAAYDKPGLLEEWTWARQAEVLDSVYSRLLEGAP